MENVLGEDFPVEIYHSFDEIKNFKIRVKVRKIPNACFTEKDSLSFGDTNEIELINLMKASSISDERDFKWQEKVPKTNKRDDEKFSGDSSKRNSLSICLFSYIDSEILSPLWMKNSLSITYPPSNSSLLEDRMMKTKPKTRLKFPDRETWQKPLFSDSKRIVKTQSKTKDATFSVGQSMVLMAALFFEDSETSEEIELCYLQLDDNGSLTVIPDMNKRKSYTFVNSRSETFEYELENVSSVLTDSSLQREKNLMEKIASYKERIKVNAVGSEFFKPQPDHGLFTLSCEIVSAKNFSSSDIFVHFLIILPQGLNSEDNLEGVTHTCQCNVTDFVSEANFGHVFSLECIADMQKWDSEPLKIILDVTSVDQWGNFRNEGYGYKDILLSPGMHSFDIYTWKVEPTSLKHKLQNFFIGGMPHLEDLSYVINKKSKESQLSRYGVCTKSSGVITLKSYILFQSNKENT